MTSWRLETQSTYNLETIIYIASINVHGPQWELNLHIIQH